MFEGRDRRIDLFSIAFAALTVVVSLSVISYDPADPVVKLVWPLNLIHQPDTLVYPLSDQPRNWCGNVGATLADLLFTTIGWGTYYLAGSMLILLVHLIRKGPIRAPMARSVGWILSLISLTSIVSMISPSSFRGPVIGPGGYLGTLGNAVLHEHFAQAGGFILAASLFIAGMLLWTDYVVFQLMFFVIAVAVDRLVGRRAGLGGSSRTARASTTVLKADDTAGLAVRIGGKRVKRVADPPDDLAENPLHELKTEKSRGEDGDERSIEDEEEPHEFSPAARKAMRGIAGRTSAPLRFRKPAAVDERQEVMAQLDEASRHEETAEYDLPSMDLLIESESYSFDDQENEVRRKAKILERTFRDFGFQVKVVEVETGPVIAQYEIELEAGLRLSKITGLADDLAIALRAPSVRIVAPIPGKNTVGIEVPNDRRQVVRLREVMEEAADRIKKMHIPLFLGKDVSGNPLTVDLASLPHLLIAGRTGTGKSVCLNAIIASILMTRRPDEVRMLMIDPKMVELSGYRTLPHLMHPVVTDMRKAEALLAWAVDKMEERYQLLARAGVRHISGYNQLGEEELMRTLEPESDEERQSIPLTLPYIVIVADEMADLMMTAGKEVEQHIIRLAQKSRAVGIHLILATQKPTVDVITGLIKSNLPARICFQVASRTDSRVVLDEMGADKLLGNGDMLFLWPGTSSLLRGQGTYLEDSEIKQIVDCVSTGEQHFVNELVHLKVNEPSETVVGGFKKRDDLYEGAVDIVIREGRGSVSLLQRTLGIGYGRAARMIDWMAEDGIVGGYAGSQAREVLISLSQWEQMRHGSEAGGNDEPEFPWEDHESGRSQQILPLSKWHDEPARPAGKGRPPGKRSSARRMQPASANHQHGELQPPDEYVGQEYQPGDYDTPIEHIRVDEADAAEYAHEDNVDYDDDEFRPEKFEVERA
jgi:S-DNA-T family DNA segregation ATPase FtsK/SpoIIIE